MLFNPEKVANGTWDPKLMYVVFYYTGHGCMMHNYVCVIQPTAKDAKKREWDDAVNIFYLEQKIDEELVGRSDTLTIQKYFDCCRSE